MLEMNSTPIVVAMMVYHMFRDELSIAAMEPR